MKISKVFKLEFAIQSFCKSFHQENFKFVGFSTIICIKVRKITRIKESKRNQGVLSCGDGRRRRRRRREKLRKVWCFYASKCVK